MIKSNTDNRGFILVFSILIVIVLGALMGIFSSIGVVNYSLAKSDETSQKAYYVAQSGVEYALAVIENYDPGNQETWPNGAGFSDFGGSITVSITDDGSGGYNITSTGTVSSRTQTIKVHTSSTGAILSWE